MVQEMEPRYGGDKTGGGSGSHDSRAPAETGFYKDVQRDRPGRRFRSLSKVVHAKNLCQGWVRARVLFTDRECAVGT